MRTRLDGEWTFAGTAPGRIADPGGLGELAQQAWRPARVPGTVAAGLGLGPDADPGLEDHDWWFRCRFGAPDRGAGRQRLRFEGLATIAQVWLNGERLLESRNMFVERSAEVTGRLRDDNELLIVFRSLRPEFGRRRARPRWRTALVEQQALRWVRTTLLGRIPGWTPALPPIGPWRPVHLEPVPRIGPPDLRCRLDGDDGVLRIAAEVDDDVRSATLHAGAWSLPVEAHDGVLRGTHRLPGVPKWWPHTHGEPALLDCTLELRTSGGTHAVRCGRIGFRSVRWSPDDGRWTVNGRTLFARGACWTGEGLTTEDPARLEASLERAREAGLNMLRVVGTSAYGSERFYERCDALGLLVWQDFMFANMDYPFEEPGFRAEVLEEVVSVLRRLRAHPCIAAWCGGSEIHQQAAMLGLPAAERAVPFLEQTLPALCEAEHGDAPCVPGTPWGGALPFLPGEGICHYYGVGAYRRPLHDLRRSRVRFTAECLGFSNVPDAAAVERLSGHRAPVPHLPAWKAGVPRDTGAGWDFEDVRDHYLRELFGLDAVALRSTDPARYLDVSRVVTGELMLRAFAEWRRPGSGCGGALVWFWQDLRPGAGWGVLDADARPKAAWWYLRRAWAARAVLMTDEGLDGVTLHVHNEHPAPLAGHVELELIQHARRSAGRARVPVALAPFDAVTLSAEAMLGRFVDVGWTYRFGPPGHEIVVARLLDHEGRVLHEDAWFPLGHALPMQPSDALHASARRTGGGEVELEVYGDAFLQAVTVRCDDHDTSDDVFHLAPGHPRTLRLRPRPGAAGPFRAHLSALNLDGGATVRA